MDDLSFYQEIVVVLLVIIAVSAWKIAFGFGLGSRFEEMTRRLERALKRIENKLEQEEEGWSEYE